jgi:hypothetical protein
MRRMKLSRRAFVWMGSAAAVAGLTRVDAARAASPWQAYHDYSVGDHLALQPRLVADGYRPVSVSIYGQVTAPRVACSWVQRSGPDWRIATNLDAAAFQEFFEACAADNFRFTQLAATGSATDPRYMAVAELSDFGIPVTRPMLHSGSDADERTLQHWLKWARANGQIPRSLATFGAADDPRYAVVFEPNDAGVSWNADGCNESDSEFQQRCDAQRAHHARPAIVALSPTGRYLSLFRSDQLTAGWVFRHHLSSSQLVAERAVQRKLDNYPIYLSGGGSGANPRFAAIFAASDSVTPFATEPTDAQLDPLLGGVF